MKNNISTFYKIGFENCETFTVGTIKNIIIIVN